MRRREGKERGCSKGMRVRRRVGEGLIIICFGLAF